MDVPRTAPNVAFFHEPAVQKSLERMLYIWGIRCVLYGTVYCMGRLYGGRGPHANMRG